MVNCELGAMFRDLQPQQKFLEMSKFQKTLAET